MGERITKNIYINEGISIETCDERVKRRHHDIRIIITRAFFHRTLHIKIVAKYFLDVCYTRDNARRVSITR